MLTLLMVDVCSGDAALNYQAQSGHRRPYGEDYPRKPAGHWLDGPQSDTFPYLEFKSGDYDDENRHSMIDSTYPVYHVQSLDEIIDRHG